MPIFYVTKCKNKQPELFVMFEIIIYYFSSCYCYYSLFCHSYVLLLAITMFYRPPCHLYSKLFNVLKD